ncbi:MAG: hypothetical protein HQL87_15810 [Magnetococcales bacterium]|nr:hypothetical protein [Magnetococcales bacterium]
MKKQRTPVPPTPSVPATADLAPIPAETPPPVAKQPTGRLKKSAKVDEQLFQEGLAISLDNEKRPGKKPAATRKVKETAAQKMNRAPGTIMDEFQDMIDDMLPSTRQERAACLQHTGKADATRAKAGHKKGKKSGKTKNRHKQHPGKGKRTARQKARR